MRTATITLGTVLFGLTLAHAQVPSSIRPIPQGRYGAIGCLTRQGTAAARRYVVTDKRTGEVYRLDGDRALLERHVGHTVETSGTLTRIAGSNRYTMKVASLVWLAASCEAKK
jgi:hypothetical protein